MFKREKGITLIALIVTIIVLLILAGVTISIAVSNNGIFTKARTAGNTYKKAEHDESVGLNTADTDMQNVMNEYGLK